MSGCCCVLLRERPVSRVDVRAIGCVYSEDGEGKVPSDVSVVGMGKVRFHWMCL